MPGRNKFASVSDEQLLAMLSKTCVNVRQYQFLVCPCTADRRDEGMTITIVLPASSRRQALRRFTRYFPNMKRIAAGRAKS